MTEHSDRAFLYAERKKKFERRQESGVADMLINQNDGEQTRCNHKDAFP